MATNSSFKHVYSNALGVRCETLEFFDARVEASVLRAWLAVCAARTAAHGRGALSYWREPAQRGPWDAQAEPVGGT